MITNPLQERIAVDFETEAIQRRPAYPPRPVGVAIKSPGKKAVYWRWGHPDGNNCSLAKARRVLSAAWRSRTPKVFHNAGFDMEVAARWFDLPLLAPEQYDDTMFLAFLVDPRSRTLALKPLSDAYLSRPPEEQEELNEWIRANCRTTKGARISKGKEGAYIAAAPGDLVDPYARGDVERTAALYDRFIRHVLHWRMYDAYTIEKRVLPIVLEMEARGIRLDTSTLRADTEKAERRLRSLAAAARRKLGGINVDSGIQIADAMEARGLVSEWEYTEKMNRKTSRDSLARCCTDAALVRTLDNYSRLKKIVTTYMRPWLESAEENAGLFYPWFNQVRGDNGYGTKTGRFSSNFQQVPKRADDPALPYMRNYVVGDKSNHVLLLRDFSQQELRILAHYEEGDMLRAYQRDPTVDIHAMVGELIKVRARKQYARPLIKIADFLMVYGGGAPALAVQGKMNLDAARDVVDAHRKALPGVHRLMKKIGRDTRSDPIRTAGGRVYYAEQDFYYKMLNTLIQASAADHTKRAMINVHAALSAVPGARIVLQVHDELMCSAPKRLQDKAMRVFREAMEQDDLFSIPMLSDGKVGRSWGTATSYNDRRND